MAAQGTQDHRISIIEGGSSSRTHPVQPMSLLGMTRPRVGPGEGEEGAVLLGGPGHPGHPRLGGQEQVEGEDGGGAGGRGQACLTSDYFVKI